MGRVWCNDNVFPRCDHRRNDSHMELLHVSVVLVRRRRVHLAHPTRPRPHARIAIITSGAKNNPSGNDVVQGIVVARCRRHHDDVVFHHKNGILAEPRCNHHELMTRIHARRIVVMTHVMCELGRTYRLLARRNGARERMGWAPCTVVFAPVRVHVNVARAAVMSRARGSKKRREGLVDVRVSRIATNGASLVRDGRVTPHTTSMAVGTSKQGRTLVVAHDTSRHIP